MSKTKITKRSVDALTPNDRLQLIYDTELSGFGIRLMPSGHAAYIIEYRPGGGGRRISKKRMAIGTVGSSVIEAAGFKPMGEREGVRADGSVRRSRYWEMTREEWDRRRNP